MIDASLNRGSPTGAPDSLEALISQVADDYVQRLERGQQPEIEEYAGRHPQIAAVLRQVLPALALLRRSGPAATDSPDEVQPEGPLGDYRIVREVGRGGMGVVYEAVQISLGRRVALKILPLAGALDPKQLQRFKNEARAAAQLHHPHIVPVHGVGCERGIHYYAMQFIEGQTLAALIREFRHQAGNEDPGAKAPAEAATVEDRGPGNATPPTTPRSSILDQRPSSFFRAVATLGVQAAEALEHAHQQGVIHRDIKPANLLIDGAGNLWITDFGLARLQGDAGLTMSGDLLGTLRYMSPEQALGKGGLGDPRTDVYALGVTLYELLTLEPAYNGPERHEVLRQIAEDEPIPARRLNQAVPGELETIVLKAMSKSADERYASAQELADDLRRYLEDKPIRARRPSLRQRAAKWARRHKTVVRAALIMLLLAVVALVISTVFIWRAKEDVDRANADLKQAYERERQNAYYQRIALAEREWSANNLNRMLQLLDECPPDLRAWEWHYLQRLRLQALPPLRHDSAVFCAAFSPDGERIASASQDGKVTIWDAQSGGQLLQFRAHREHARGVAYSPDGRLLATTSLDNTVKIWDVQALAKDPNPSPLRCMTRQGVSNYSVMFSPDGKRLASAGPRSIRSDGLGEDLAEVTIWDPISGQELCTLEGREPGMWSALTFSPDSQSVATGHHEGHGDGIIGKVVHVWDANTGRKVRTFAGHTQDVESVAFSPDGRFLASGSGKPSDAVGTDGELKLWDIQTGRELLDLRGHITVFALAFSPDGRRLASAGGDQTIKLWDTATGKEALTLRGHLGTVRSLAFSPNGQRLVSASHDMTVRVWDATPLNGKSDSADLTLRGHQGDVASVAFSPDGRYVVSAGLDRSIRVWDPHSGSELKRLPVPKGIPLTIVFSPDGRWLASRGSKGPTVTIWDTTAWEVSRTFSQPSNDLNHCVAFSPDGKLFAVGGHSAFEGTERTISIRDTTTGREIHRLRGHTWNISGVAFDRTGQFLASAGTDSTVRIWNVRAGKEVVTLQPKHEGSATSVAFSPDGKCLATGSQDRAVKIWSAATWKLVHAIQDAHGGINSVAFASDSRRLAWGGTDATVKVADATTGQILETLRGHTGPVSSVAISPDGQQIASASADSTVRIWKAPAVAKLPATGTRDQDP